MIVAGTRIILASASRSRTALLAAAGIAHECIPADLDEATLRHGFRMMNMSAADVAEALARGKAAGVSQTYPEAFVIGADQMLDCGGVWLEKPATLEQARDQLDQLKGRTHHLVCGVCLARGGQVLWSHREQARMTMRRFSSGFIDRYLELAGADVLDSVGSYRLEGLGSQLFTRIKGDYFTILGLPLLPLLGAMREQGIVLR